MNNFSKTILAFSLIASSQTYSMQLARPVSQVTKRTLLRRLMSTAKDSQTKEFTNAELQEELKLIKQELTKANRRLLFGVTAITLYVIGSRIEIEVTKKK